jgi:hypothetical protein
MILDEVKADVEVSGEIKTSGFKIRTTAKAFQILSSNIYTNKIEAVVREISCNAVDAHVAAKNENPFDVHLPTQIEPFFAVRDYGTGLSEEDVLEIYTTYFSSTKNGSNEYIGALGLGSKSPFSVAESFNVVSFFNGVKSIYNCHKDENGEPQIAVIVSEETPEPNGLYVKVQVKPSEIDLYTDAACKVFRWFNKTPNINNKNVIDDIKFFKESTTSETEDFITNSDISENLVLMGNVAYQLTHPKIPDCGIIFKCKIGEVSFDPGRERVTNDEKTMKFLSDKFTAIKSSISKEIYNFLDDPNFTISDKITKVAKWMGTLYRSSAVSNFKLWASRNILCSDAKVILLKRNMHRIKTNKIVTTISDIVNFISDENCINWIKNPDPKKPISDYFAGKVNEYLRSLNREHVCIIVNDEQIQSLGISNITELPKKQRTYSGGRTKNPHKYYIVDSYKFSNFRSIEENKIPKEEKIYVQYKNNIPLGSLDYWGSIKKAAETLKKTIYAVHFSVFKSKTFNANGWISLDDYLERFKKNNPKKPVYKKSFNSMVESHILDFAKVEGVKHRKLLEQFSDLAIDKNDKPEYKLTKHYEDSDKLEKLYQKIISVHPIFKLTSGYYDQEVIKFYLTKGK